MGNQKIKKLLDSYFNLQRKFFFRHLNSEDIDSKEMYNKAWNIVEQIENILNCKHKEYVIVNLELSDPIWFVDENNIFPTAINLDQLKRKIEECDCMITRRWCNPILICVPIEVYKWLDKNCNSEVYCDLAIYAIAGPNGGYTSNYYDWIKLNRKYYLPKVFEIAKEKQHDR